jgi:hypothetical protein
MALLPIIASIAGGAISALGSRSAARTQTSGANQAARMQIEAAERASAEQRAAAERAAREQRGLTREGIDVQNRGVTDANRMVQFGVNDANRTLGTARDQDIARFDPFFNTGTMAQNALAFNMGLGDRPEGYGGFQTSPGFQFAFDQGMNAVQGSVAGRQGLNSGAAMQELNRFGQGIANQEFGNYLQRLAGLASSGQSAAGSQANISQNAASQMAGNTMQGGMMRGGNTMQGGVNTGNALMNLGSQLGNLTVGTGNNIAGNIMQAGQAGAQGVANAANARAAGNVGMANAFAGGINNGLGVWQFNQMQDAFANANQPGGYSTGAPVTSGWTPPAPTFSTGVPVASPAANPFRIGMPRGGR